LKTSGLVEFYTQDCDSPEKLDGIEEAVGNSLAILLFFGMSDQHVENLRFGANHRSGKAEVFPIDIEIIFDNLMYLSQTNSIRSLGSVAERVGTYSVFNCGLEPARILWSFLDCNAVLQNSTSKIRMILGSSDLEKIPIRRVIKGTSRYRKFMDGGLKADEFEKEELIQMERNDIPYFFSFLGSNTVYFLEKGEKGDISLPVSFPIEKYLLPTVEECIKPVNSRSLKISILQIARNFDPGTDRISSYGETRIRYDNNKIFVDCNDGLKLKCERLR